MSGRATGVSDQESGDGSQETGAKNIGLGSPVSHLPSPDYLTPDPCPLTPGPILVTGGAGFIGSHLVKLLLERGQKVRVLERPGAKIDHLPLDRIELVHVDIRFKRAIAGAVAGCSRVYHLAANPHLWAQQRGLFHQVNYQGTKNVLEAALDAGATRILHVSTESILTRAIQTEPIAEDQHVSIKDVVGPYCRSKHRAEKYASQLARSGAPIVIVNPTLPIGPGDWGRSPPTQMILDFCLGKRKEYLDADLNMIDVRDVALGMFLAMERGLPGRRYLFGHENLSIHKVFQLLSKICGIPEPTRHVPYGVALTAAYVNEFVSDVFTHQMPVATVTGVKLTRRRMQFDASRSLAALGLQPRPIVQSLADAVQWYREVGWVPGNTAGV